MVVDMEVGEGNLGMRVIWAHKNESKHRMYKTHYFAH